MASVICALLRSPRQRLGVLHLDRGLKQEPFTREDLQLADALAASISVGIECAQVVEKHREPFLVKAAAFVRRAIELRDPHTGRHVERVKMYASWLADELRLPPEDCKNLQVGALLHDVGKIAVRDAVLQKRDKLTPAELAVMREQTLKGVALAECLPDLAPVLPIIRSHHERWDGTGYPDGLAGESIPLLARIVAIADAFDAMTVDQPYRHARPLQEAFAELNAGAGTQFDPKLVQVFCHLGPRLEASLRTK
jgi:HD-GYP domain-containing protein (c-di-GMP phosphodiesterase class II)